jgi:hypothetical protein
MIYISITRWGKVLTAILHEYVNEISYWDFLLNFWMMGSPQTGQFEMWYHDQKSVDLDVQ